MSRTRYLTLRCHHPGCRETGSVACNNQREVAEERAKPWHCYRHSEPDEVLTPETPVRITTWVSVQTSDGLLIGPPGREYQGAVDGPGFKFFASDFPAGSRLVVSVQVLPPAEESR